MLDLRFSEVDFGSPAYDALVSLRTEVLRRPLGLTFSPEQLAAERGQRHVGCYTVDLLMGCLLLKDLGAGQVQMRQVAVRPEAQGQGIGQMLVAHAETLAAASGGLTIVLHARETAVGFYERLGYRRVGAQFVEVTLPHWEMTKSLE